MSLPADSARPERSVTKVLQRIPGGSAGTKPANEALLLAPAPAFADHNVVDQHRSDAVVMQLHEEAVLVVAKPHVRDRHEAFAIMGPLRRHVENGEDDRDGRHKQRCDGRDWRRRDRGSQSGRKRSPAWVVLDSRMPLRWHHCGITVMPAGSASDPHSPMRSMGQRGAIRSPPRGARSRDGGEATRGMGWNSKGQAKNQLAPRPRTLPPAGRATHIYRRWIAFQGSMGVGYPLQVSTLISIREPAPASIHNPMTMFRLRR